TSLIANQARVHPKLSYDFTEDELYLLRLCEAVVAVNDVKGPSQFGQETDCFLFVVSGKREPQCRKLLVSFEPAKSFLPGRTPALHMASLKNGSAPLVPRAWDPPSLSAQGERTQAGTAASRSSWNQPDVVTEVHHPDLKPRPRDADGAHDLAPASSAGGQIR